MTGLLVTGTDTGVGKTHLACAIARAWTRAGHSVGVMKPCETGVVDPASATLDPAGDAARLVEAARCEAPIADVVPYRFALPAAPSAAARAARASLDVGVVERAYRRLERAYELVLVEGAGGLAVPLATGFDYADLAARLGLAVLIVARTGLGTLNHTALTERVARARGLDVVGIVLDEAEGPTSDDDRANLAVLGEVVDAPVLGECPFDAATTPALDRAFERLASALIAR